MDIEVLKTMQILSQTKSFSKTAEIQNIVQSTVSARIAELEKTLGQKLFIRDNQRVDLTQSGLMFLPYAQHILEELENGKAKLNSATLFDDSLVIGNVYSILPNLLFPVYREYLRSFPRISVKAVAGHSTDILQSLVDGIIDIAIVYQLPRIRRFATFLCNEEDFVFICPPDDPLADRTEIPVKDLEKINLLFHDWGGSFSDWIAQLFPGTRWFHANIGNPSFIVSLVEEGAGAAILTRSTVQKALARNSVVEVPLTGSPLPPRWQTYAVTHPKRLARQPVRDWLDMMSKYDLTAVPI
ncbi:LysR family transcriptional regulator [Sporomusa sp. KB1]|uniref:LysR family transcriptional regulator n=1 Tax=Sporomusa sp. KB1 TaxID=943346 RepID=UPI00119E60EB|nr:LysR family transcriptional regulator [Sporomusa sp. KB1]TWH51657.1 DNA-binding transcriptional LysR family regulator [Sporomusa sp. KB1]TWH52236.1 DNA-binding transcriptional LysR family regulator [Sporomusa sp. KB1]